MLMVQLERSTLQLGIKFYLLTSVKSGYLASVIPVSSVIPALLEFGWIPGNPQKNSIIYIGINCYSELPL